MTAQTDEHALRHETRYVAIGDIHGCLDPLERLVEKINPSPTDILVFLGDYVDRGPNSKGVIDYLIDLKMRRNAVFLLGNHEVLMLDFLAGLLSPSDWERNGGVATLESYSENGALDIPDSHIEFLQSCLPYYDSPDYFFVHGGLKPHRGIEENLRRMSTLELVWERSHLEEPHVSAEDYKWEKTVVCGHTPLAQPLVLDKLIAIDTGCVYSHESRLGRLTAISLPDRSIVQVDNRAPRTVAQRLFARFQR